MTSAELVAAGGWDKQTAGTSMGSAHRGELPSEITKVKQRGDQTTAHLMGVDGCMQRLARHLGAWELQVVGALNNAHARP